GERLLRGGAADPSVNQAMETAQTYAALVAAQLAAGRIPVGSAGLQVTEVTGTARATGLRTGDVLLAAGDTRHLTPLRTEACLRPPPVKADAPRVLAAPRISGEAVGGSAIERLPAARLAAVRTDPVVSATAYPLGVVQGPSAGLMLALARVDALS